MRELLNKKDAQNPKSFEDLGYIYFGPLVFCFFEWLKDEVVDCDLVLFNSREGYFLNQIYKIFQNKYKLPKSLYFKTSRKLSAISSFKTEDDIYESFKLHRYFGTLHSLLKDRFGLNCFIENDEQIDTKIKLPKLDNFIEDILKKSIYVREQYGTYIKECIRNSNRIAMIDSGFQGTTQYYLQKTFQFNFEGRYITYKGNLPLKNTKGFLDFEKTKFKDNMIFFESVFTDSIGSFIDIKNNNFICEELDNSTNFFSEKEKIVYGIKMFINDIQSIKYNCSSNDLRFIDDNFNLMCKHGFIKNEKLFDIFFHDNYYTRNTSKKIVKK